MFLEAVTLASLLGVAMPVSTGWRPINRPLPAALPHQTVSYQSHIPEPSEDGCTLYKALFDQESPSQYVQYKAPIPDMKEFTLCMWHKLYNHSRDQPLFTYSSSHERARDIYSWVSNDDRSSYYMMAVMGQTMYRLNYPVRLHKWYHSCQSWNGRTGEWQMWINSERIGRGFHNLLVGKTIKGGGVALSGQEPINNAVRGYQDLYKPTGGVYGEITLVQLYKAALTAGKAYTNHKHHHAHHFHHDDKLGEDDYRIDGMDPPPSGEPVNTGNEFPYLRHGQLIPSLPVHELSAFRGQQQNLLTPQVNVLGSTILSPAQDNPYSLQNTRLYKRDHNKDNLKTVTPSSTKSVIRRIIRTKRLKETQPLDTDEDDELDEKMAFKRDIEKVTRDDEDDQINDERKEVKRDLESVSIDKIEELISEEKRVEIEKNDSKKETENAGTVKRDIEDIEEGKIEEDSKNTKPSKKIGEREKRSKDEEEVNNENNNDEIKSKSKRETEQTEKVQKKRTALLGDAPFGVIPGSDLSGLFAGDGYVLGQSSLRFNDENNHHQSEEETQMEPAEWEVRSIMGVCTGCSEDPFRKATLISWRETPKKLFSGVLYIPAISECQRF